MRLAVSSNAMIEGFIEKKGSDGGWERCYCVLSGKYLYFYKDKDQNTTYDYFYLKSADVFEDEAKYQITVKGQNDQRVIKVLDLKSWAKAIRAKTIEILLE
jgi:VCBS repeat-containing protein